MGSSLLFLTKPKIMLSLCKKLHSNFIWTTLKQWCIHLLSITVKTVSWHTIVLWQFWTITSMIRWQFIFSKLGKWTFSSWPIKALKSSTFLMGVQDNLQELSKPLPSQSRLKLMMNGTSLLLAMAKVHVMALVWHLKGSQPLQDFNEQKEQNPSWIDWHCTYNIAVTALPTFNFTTSEKHEAHWLLLPERFNNARTIAGKIVHEIITIFFSTQQRGIPWK